MRYHKIPRINIINYHYLIPESETGAFSCTPSVLKKKLKVGEDVTPPNTMNLISV